MANSQKISSLNEVSSPLITDVFPIVSNGETKKVTLDVVIQQASITISSYINSLLLNYASLNYVKALAVSLSTNSTLYTNTRIDEISAVIDADYAKITYVDTTVANYIPITSRQSIIDDTITLTETYYIKLSDQQTIIDAASSAAITYSSHYTDDAVLNYIPITSRQSIIDDTITLTETYYIKLSDQQTLLDSTSAAAIAYSKDYTDTTFIPLISTDTIIEAASSLAASYADFLLAGLGGTILTEADRSPIIHSASSLAVEYSTTYANNTFIPISSTSAIVKSASSQAVAYSTIYTNSYFIPISSTNTIVRSASSLAVTYANNTFIPLISTGTLIDTASSLAVAYADNTFIPLISTDTVVNTASSLAVNYIYDVKTTVESYSAAWLNPIKEFDYTLTGSTYISYSGTAIYGSSRSSNVWLIKKITYNSIGGVASVEKAVNAVWDDRKTSVVYFP